MLLIEDTVSIQEIDDKNFDLVTRWFGQTQVHKINLLCDVHNGLITTNPGDSIQIKIVTNLTDDTKNEEISYTDLKNYLKGPSLADSFSYIMHGRIYDIKDADINLTASSRTRSIYISHGGLLMRIQYDESKIKLGPLKIGDTLFTCMRKITL
ncbi:MAG: DNA-directed RNA polymerases I, II, and III subunit RPABC3 [Marteilia pararefringens]